MELLETVALHQTTALASWSWGGSWFFCSFSARHPVSYESVRFFTVLCFFFSLLLVHVCRLKHLQERDRISSPLSVSVGLGQSWRVGPGAVQEVYPAHVWSVNSREVKSGWLWQL